MLRSIQENIPGLGISFASSVDTVSINISKVNVATFAFSIDDTFEVFVRVEVLEGGDIIQTATVKNVTSTVALASCDINLGVGLNRASYGQLTEGGPIPLPESHNVIWFGHNRSANITNPALGAQLACQLRDDADEFATTWSTGSDEKRGEVLRVTVAQHRHLRPHVSWTWRMRFRLLPLTKTYHFEPSIWELQAGRHVEDRHTQPSIWTQSGTITTYIIRRNVEYILANCTVPILSSIAPSVSIVTDHVALPLGWNRDNYWQLHLLYETHKNASVLFQSKDTSEYISKIHSVAKGHLIWVFRTAQRPHGYWHRSYLVTGKPKDGGVFQLDQQCYPLLELCDYFDHFPEDMTFVRQTLELGTVSQILELLEQKRDEETGLWPTDETPGDDAVEYPYHFSSHVLLWRTLIRLSSLYSTIQSPSSASADRLSALADALRISTLQHFTVMHPDSSRNIFAYLTNGRDAHTFYHDANDIPTLLASSSHWSFVRSPSELLTWNNTMTFGLSPANVQGYCLGGAYPGLGSVHSPGAWVLGYFQELAYAVICENEKDMKTAWKKVTNAMQWDGTFSEAVDPKTGECSSKAWFSWPGSMIGALLIQLRKGGLEHVLLQGE